MLHSDREDQQLTFLHDLNHSDIFFLHFSYFQVNTYLIQAYLFIQLNQLMDSQSRTFDPKTYLTEWFPAPQGDDLYTRWMIEAISKIPECKWGLEVGCGPVVTLSAIASRKVQKIILSEYNLECFKYIQAWRDNQQGSPYYFDWNPFFDLIADLENKLLSGNPQTGSDVAARQRKCIDRLIKVDMSKPEIFQEPIPEKFDIVMSSLCLEAVAVDKADYKAMIGRLKKYLQPQGYFYIMGCIDETVYKVGEQVLPVLSTSTQFVIDSLAEHGFEIRDFCYKISPPAPGEDEKGFFSILAQLK